jgi:hypothetical protein
VFLYKWLAIGGKFQVNYLNYPSLALKRLATARETVHLTGETVSQTFHETTLSYSCFLRAASGYGFGSWGVGG